MARYNISEFDIIDQHRLAGLQVYPSYQFLDLSQLWDPPSPFKKGEWTFPILAELKGVELFD